MKLSKNDINVAKAIIGLILEVGVPATIKGIKTFSVSDNPTPEEIEDLSNILKDSDEYWEK